MALYVLFVLFLLPPSSLLSLVFLFLQPLPSPLLSFSSSSPSSSSSSSSSSSTSSSSTSSSSFRLHHQRSRYVYELFYKRRAISRGQRPPSYIHSNNSQLTIKGDCLAGTSLYMQFLPSWPSYANHYWENILHAQTHLTFLYTPPLELYEYCLNEGYADKNLIAKWKKVKCWIGSSLVHRLFHTASDGKLGGVWVRGYDTWLYSGTLQHSSTVDTHNITDNSEVPTVLPFTSILKQPLNIGHPTTSYNGLLSSDVAKVPWLPGQMVGMATCYYKWTLTPALSTWGSYLLLKLTKLKIVDKRHWQFYSTWHNIYTAMLLWFR